MTSSRSSPDGPATPDSAGRPSKQLDDQPGLMAELCHELRTSIGAFSGLVGMAAQDTHKAQTAEMLRVALEQADYMLALVNDTLELARLDAAPEPSTIPFSPADLVRSCSAAFSAQAQARQIRLTTFVAHDLPALIFGDPRRLRQVLNNLLVNAIKFTHEGGVTVQANWRTVGSRGGTTELILTISDSGIGFDGKLADKIFRPFVQAEPDTAERYGGTGLGLAITKRLVESMQGSITVHSAPGLGTTFDVRIPALIKSA